MTDKELRQNYRLINDVKDEVLKTQARKKLDCISMINSCIAYSPINLGSDLLIPYVIGNKYLEKYISMMGKKIVKKLIQEQINSIVTIRKDVYTDGEGVTYNSIVWKE